MATKIFRGDAVARAQTQTYAFAGTWSAADTISVVINNKTFTTAAGSTVIDTIIQNLVAAWLALNGSTWPELVNEITPSWPSTGLLLLTASTPGVPFTVTSITTNSAGGTIGAASVTQVSTGPHHYDEALNWQPSGVPANGDDVDFSHTTVAVLYGLNQQTIHPNTVHQPASCSVPFGNKDFNDLGYWEYRTTQLTYAYVANGWTIGDGPGPGSGRVRCKVTDGANVTTFNVLGSGQPEVDGVKAVQIETGGAANVVNVSRGSVETAGQDGQSATVANLRVGYQQNQTSDSDVLCGAGCALTTIDKSGGHLETNSAITTLTQYEGTSGDVIHRAGAVATLTIKGGVVAYNATATLTTANLYGTGLLDFSQDLRPKTLTNTVQIYSADAHVHDPHRVVNQGGNLVQKFNGLPIEINGGAVGTDLTITRN